MASGAQPPFQPAAVARRREADGEIDAARKQIGDGEAARPFLLLRRRQSRPVASPSEGSTPRKRLISGSSLFRNVSTFWLVMPSSSA